VAFGQGLQRLLVARITTAEALLTLDVTPVPNSPVAIDEVALGVISDVESVAAVSPVRSRRATATFEGVTAGVIADFIDDRFFRLSGLNKLFLIGGNVGSTGGAFTGPRDVVLSRAVLDLLSIDDDPSGLIIQVRVQSEAGDVLNTAYTVVGVIDDEFNGVMYVPAVSFPVGSGESYDAVKVQVKSTMVIESVRESIVALGFTVAALSDTVKQANRVFGVMQIILAIFGAVALMVAAIGMFNTMTIALLERTPEIGIMRSIGASRRDIWVLFLSEALILGFLGGLSGVIIGIGMGELSNAGLNILAARLGGEALDVFYYPVWFVIAIVLFSTVVSVITGFYPAQRAAHLNPLDALRYK